jgi:hypothetical protein
MSDTTEIDRQWWKDAMADAVMVRDEIAAELATREGEPETAEFDDLRQQYWQMCDQVEWLFSQAESEGGVQ